MTHPLRHLTALAVAGVLLAACGNKADEAAADAAAASGLALDAERVVNVYNWSDYIEPGMLDAFTKETGIQVNYEVMDSNEMLETKLVAGRTGYDVVVPSASFLARQIKLGIYQKLDKSLLKNLGNLDPDLTRRQQVFDPGNEYSVNYMWGTSGVAYNEDRIKAIMPDAPVDSFAMFWDPKVVSKFASCGVHILDAPSEVVGTILIWLGRDANSEKPEDLKAAEDVLMAVRPHIRLVHSSKYIEDLAGGEICLALGWSGDALMAASRAEENGKDFTIKYAIPKEGAVQFFDNMAIPADAKHVKNAHAFMDFMLRADVATANSNFLSYANTNAASWPTISPEVKDNPNVYPPPEMMAKIVPDMPETAEFTKELTRVWQRFRTGK